MLNRPTTILILGAGPTGLGAAWWLERLRREGRLPAGTDWQLWEASEQPGGLAGSVIDERGFTWDVGGHVQFSHYQLFDEAMDDALGAAGWLWHERESWVRCAGTWVPYPFQMNLHRLPPAEGQRCLAGLEAAREALRARGPEPPRWANFGQMIDGVFGQGLAELFMRPYNFKVWAWPPEELNVGWIGERVALPDVEQIRATLASGQDQVSWGPNNRFRFPLRGGTGAVWRAMAAGLPAERQHYGRRLVALDPAAHEARAADGTRLRYDALLSTLPVTELIELAGFSALREPAALLRHSAVHIVGVGLHGAPGPQVARKCWMYFPEGDCPFFRVTVFSNYSPNNVPDITRYWSLMAEISESPAKPVDRARVAEATIEGMLATGLIESRAQVTHTWQLSVERGYPTPSLRRDEALAALLPALEGHGIYSRGRFGAWKYEVSNQDHSFAQGVEAVQAMLFGAPELTLWFPNLVNSPHPVHGRVWHR